MIILMPKWSKSDKEHQRNTSNKKSDICNTIATIISLLVSKKQYNKTRRYYLSIFQVSCNDLVYFIFYRSSQLYTRILFHLQDFNIFDGATKTTTKRPQHSFSYPYKKRYFQGWKWSLFIFLFRINGWTTSVIYLNKYVGVIWKSNIF